MPVLWYTCHCLVREAETHVSSSLTSLHVCMFLSFYLFFGVCFQANFGLEPAMLVHGVKMVFVPVMPGHKKRLNQP